MKRTRACPECEGIVVPFKRGQDPDAALINHIRLSHPNVTMAINVTELLQPNQPGANQP